MTWITSTEAITILGVKPQTLYANVSRGRIRVKPDSADPRRRRYNREDVRRLTERRSGRKATAAIAASTIDWGDPVLSSTVSTVHDGRLWYRGKDAVALSETAHLEDIASLLWEAKIDSFSGVPSLGHYRETRRVPRSAQHPSPLTAALGVLSGCVEGDRPTIGLSRTVLAGHGAGLVDAVFEAMTGRYGADKRPMHIRLAEAWSALGAADILRRALVLLADHELNASTFAARVCASTGAPLSACLLAGLSTLGGPKHGGASEMLLTLVESSRTIGPRRAIEQWLARGHAIPAFGHPLYASGDPRAKALLKQFNRRPTFGKLRFVVDELVGEAPNVDFALAALVDAHKLPRNAAFVIFAIGRLVGWIAHSLEQAMSGRLIRPRARYIGPRLEICPPEGGR